MNAEVFDYFIWAWIGLALLLFPIQLFWVTAPYGRHLSDKYGWQMDNKLGWVLMEMVSLLFFAFFFLTGDNEKTSPMLVFFILWSLHYVNRSFIYPFRTKTSGKKIPVMIVFSAIFFNIINGWTNGYFLGSLSELYSSDWFYSTQFIFGVILFLFGAVINLHSDNYLLNLRKPGESGYKIPKGGLFKFISCPNHFGEILEWAGFAIMCWNLAALAFAIWTAANLIPRAVSHHKWYRDKFVNYPTDRKAIIPFLL